MHLHEKNGGSDRKVHLVPEFRKVVHECNLMDMGYKGYLFTWSNRRYGIQFIEERMDKVLCNKYWCMNFEFSGFSSKKCGKLGLGSLSNCF